MTNPHSPKQQIQTPPWSQAGHPNLQESPCLACLLRAKVQAWPRTPPPKGLPSTTNQQDLTESDTYLHTAPAFLEALSVSLSPSLTLSVLALLSIVEWTAANW